VPETAVYRSQLQFLFADPEMAALMAAAPAAIGRPLCSLCRMLGVLPPKILAPPAETRAPPAPKREAIREGANRPPEKPARTKRSPLYPAVPESSLSKAGALARHIVSNMES